MAASEMLDCYTVLNAVLFLLLTASGILAITNLWKPDLKKVCPSPS